MQSFASRLWKRGWPTVPNAPTPVGPTSYAVAVPATGKALSGDLPAVSGLNFKLDLSAGEATAMRPWPAASP